LIDIDIKPLIHSFGFDSPECLPILLSLSIFSFHFFLFFKFLAVLSMR